MKIELFQKLSKNDCENITSYYLLELKKLFKKEFNLYIHYHI